MVTLFYVRQLHGQHHHQLLVPVVVAQHLQPDQLLMQEARYAILACYVCIVVIYASFICQVDVVVVISVLLYVVLVFRHIRVNFYVVC